MGYKVGPRIYYMEFRGRVLLWMRDSIRIIAGGYGLHGDVLPSWDDLAGMGSWVSKNLERLCSICNPDVLIRDLESLVLDGVVAPDPGKFAGVCQCGNSCYVHRFSGSARCSFCDEVFSVRDAWSLLLERSADIPLTIARASTVLASQGIKVRSSQMISWIRRGDLYADLSETGRYLVRLTDVCRISHLKGKNFDREWKTFPLDFGEDAVYDFLSDPDVEIFARSEASRISGFAEGKIVKTRDRRSKRTKRATLRFVVGKGSVIITVVRTGNGGWESEAIDVVKP